MEDVVVYFDKSYLDRHKPIRYEKLHVNELSLLDVLFEHPRIKKGGFKRLKKTRRLIDLCNNIARADFGHITVGFDYIMKMLIVTVTAEHLFFPCGYDKIFDKIKKLKAFVCFSGIDTSTIYTGQSSAMTNMMISVPYDKGLFETAMKVFDDCGIKYS